jgi:hypothetical protein
MEQHNIISQDHNRYIDRNRYGIHICHFFTQTKKVTKAIEITEIIYSALIKM